MQTARRLVLVSHRAPIEVVRTPDGARVQPTVGGLATTLAAILRDREGTWVAWVGAHDEHGASQELGTLPYTLRPVPLRQRDIVGYYGGFANQVLWPLCHIFPERCRFHTSYWTAYRRANARFAETVREVTAPGDLIWVNDFHLCLVPAFLRAANVPARVGVFWHIPFPPPAVFGICPWRAELLSGLLGADAIGFQTHADVLNFLECVREFLDVPVGRDEVFLPGRQVHVAAVPVGVDAAHLRSEAQLPARQADAARIRDELRAEVMLLGVDRLDYTKGIFERLLGYERFLERQPNWRTRVSMVQITVPSRFNVPEYRDMKRAIDETVGRIVGRFGHDGHAPLLYHYRAFPPDELVAHYLAADIALVTPLRDGMNLVAKEYAACRRGEDGVLILSEFAGAAQELSGALLVNPYDPDTIRRRIEVALRMTADERRRRMRTMAQAVARHDLDWWAESFLALLADDPVAGAVGPDAGAA